MGEFYRFFDSTLEDKRLYNADEFAEYFRTILTNGIFNGGTNLKVSTKGSDMNVDIADGFAWINGYLYKVEGGYTLPIEQASPSNPRIDRIVIRWDKRIDNRYIKAFVLKGEENAIPTPPTLTRTDDVYELSIAQIYIEAGKSFLAAESVTDERLNSEVCGIVNSLIKADTTEIFNQFDNWYKTNVPEFEKQFSTWYSSHIPEFEKKFNDWFIQQTTEGLVTASQFVDFKVEIAAYLEEGQQKVEASLVETTAKVDTAIKETTVTNTLKVIKSGKDDEGIYTVVTYKRNADDTNYCVSTLSGGTSPMYTTRTEQYYDVTGTSVTETITYTLAYDEDENLISEV